MNDRELETRLRARYRARAGETETAPLSLRRDVAAIPRTATGPRRLFGGGRGTALLAAAALLLLSGGALAAGSGFLRLPTVVPPRPAPSVVAVATESAYATSPTRSESAAPSASPVPAAGPGGVWIPTGSMVTPRDEHEAVRLLDGRVLVVGGRAYDGPGLTSAELYDPASGTWSATGSMIHPASNFRATLLPDGRVLVGDGFEDVPDHQVYGAELYDPATGTWAATGKPLGDGGRSTATLLTDGTVLLTGGIGDPSQLYDPDSGTWTATGTMTTPRYNPTATLLPDGRVLVAGGDVFPDNATDAAELYDPDTRSWTATTNLPATGNHAFDDIRATALEDGMVLVVRWSYGEPASGRAALYDPATGTWTPTGDMADPGAASRTATRLLDGTVLLAGGSGAGDGAANAEVYDPASGSWAAAAPMFGFHARPSAILLLDGTVLVAGGFYCLDGECVASGAAELYVPRGVSPPPLPAFPNPGPPVFPSPTRSPTPIPPAAGPVPPNARQWTVTVDNKGSNPTTLFVAEDDGSGLGQLVGSATPNIVPPRSTVKVTFALPAKGVEGWAIFVNPGNDSGGSLVGPGDFGIPGKIVVTTDGQVGWLSP